MRVIKTLVGTAALGSGALALTWSGAWEWSWEIFSDRERLRAVVEDSAPLAPAVYILLLVFQAVVLPLPTPPVAFAGGLRLRDRLGLHAHLSRGSAGRCGVLFPLAHLRQGVGDPE